MYFLPNHLALFICFIHVLNPFSRSVPHTQPETCKLQQVCCRLAANCDHQADIRMRSHRLLRLDDNKSAASCELQTCCKLRTADLLQIVNCRLAASCQLHIKQNHLKTQEINTLFYFISLIKLLICLLLCKQYKNTVALKKLRFIETIKTSLL